MAPCQKIFDHCFFSLITLSTEPQIIRQKISLNMFSVHKKGGKVENLVTLSFEPTGTCMTPGSLQHLQSATAWIFMWKICLKVYSPRSKHSYMNSIDMFVNAVSRWHCMYVLWNLNHPLGTWTNYSAVLPESRSHCYKNPTKMTQMKIS